MMRIGRGLSVEFDKDANPAIDIFFGNIEFVRFQPIIPTLVHLSDAVSDCLRQFDEFVMART